MKNRIRIALFMFTLFCGILIFYLTSNNETSHSDKLIVYISGAYNAFFDDDNIVEKYSSPCSIGFSYSRGKIGVTEGNIFSKALEDYEQEKGVEIEIHYLAETVSMNASSKTLLQYSYEINEMPDLIIANKSEQIDLFSLAKQNLLYNWSDLMSQNEEIDANNYYMDVIKGGIVDEQQVVIPILFNLNGMITSSIYLNEIGLQNIEDIVSYFDMIHLFQRSCETMKNNDSIAALTETSGGYLPSILLSAAYESYFDKNIQSISVTEDVLEEIYKTISLYQKQDYSAIENWINNSYEENIENPVLKSRMLFIE